MKQFRSRLESLQRLRTQQEQLARAQIAAHQQRRLAAEQQSTQLQESLDATSESMNRLFAHRPGAEMVNGIRALYRSQQDQLHAAVQEQHAALAALDQAMRQWRTTRAELKAIRNRIESQRAEHRRDGFLQEEHRQQETAAQTRFHRASETSGVTKS